MSIIDILGWIGNLFFIVGAIFIARKKLIGFYGNAIGNIFYVIQGLLVGTLSLAVLSITLIFINIYGIYNWKKK